MRHVARELGFAVLAWLMPFLVSVCIYPLKRSHPGLFESLMGITLAASTVALELAFLSAPDNLQVHSHKALNWDCSGLPPTGCWMA